MAERSNWADALDRRELAALVLVRDVVLDFVRNWGRQPTPEEIRDLLNR